jgi:hypothetical protein
MDGEHGDSILRRRRQPRARGSQASWGKEGGDRGEHVGLLTLDGERRQTTGGGGHRRPAVVPGGGGIPVALLRREAA